MIPEDFLIEEGDINGGNPTRTINNKVIVNQAIATLPNVLYINEIKSFQCGVFSKNLIQSHTRFGPLDAPLTSYVTAKKSPFLLKANRYDEVEDLYYDTSNERHCNWMCLVRPAETHEEQNLCAHFVKNEIYFTSIKTILSKDELKVWYAPRYATFIGKNILSQNMNSSSTFGVTTSFSANEDFPNFKNVPPKKRGWKRVNQINKPQEKKPTEQQNINHQVDVGELSKDPAENSQFKINKITTTTNKLVTKQFTCPTCGKIFKKKYTYKIHLLVHSDKRDFLCQTCGKSFKRKDKLGAHVKTVHCDSVTPKKSVNQFVPKIPPNEIDKFVFKCELCVIGFQRRGMLVNHFLKKHPEIRVDSVSVLLQPILKTCITYVCPYCQKSYKSSTKRKLHINRHHPGSALPPHIRDVKRCKSTENNAMIKTGDTIELDPNKCPYCPSQYSSKSKMLKHIISKHPENASNHVGLNKTKSKKSNSKDFVDQDSSFEKLLVTNLTNTNTLEETSKTIENRLPSVDTLANISDIAETVGLSNPNFEQNINITQFNPTEPLPFFHNMEPVNNTNEIMNMRRPSQVCVSRKQFLLHSMNQEPLQSMMSYKDITNDINSTMLPSISYNPSIQVNPDDIDKVTVEPLGIW